MVVEIVAALVTAFLVVRGSGAVLDHLLYRQKRLLKEQQQRHKLELLDKAGGVVSMLLVDKEMGEAVMQKLVGHYGPALPPPETTPLLPPAAEPEEARIIIHFYVTTSRKTRCGLPPTGTIVYSTHMKHVTCKRCAHLLITE